MLPEYYPGLPYDQYLRMLRNRDEDVYSRAMDPFTRATAIPSFGSIPGTGYEDFLGRVDPTRGNRLAYFSKDYPRPKEIPKAKAKPT